MPRQTLAGPAQAGPFSTSLPLHLYRQSRTPFLPSYLPVCSGLLSAGVVRFARCKGRLPCLIRRLEVHSPQILPFHESVIGRETRRMKPCRQPCSASVKSRNGSDREKNRKKGKKADVSRHKRQVMDKKNCKTGKCSFGWPMRPCGVSQNSFAFSRRSFAERSRSCAPVLQD